MKTLLKFFAVAAAFGLAPAAAFAQAAPAAAPAAAKAPAPKPAARPIDQVSAQSQAAPARPEAISAPSGVSGEEPSNAQVANATVASRTAPQVGIGQPDGTSSLQPQYTPIGEEAAWFHNVILTPVIFVISLFVLGLLLWVVFRYRRGAHPVPSRTSHNTLLEVVWTLIPVLILVVIAVPSIRLLAHQYDPPKADITVKAIGNQWFWTYQYPDNGDIEIVSNGLSADKAKARGEPRQFAVDERMVVPAGAVVKVITTSNDVIHSFGIPAFWVKMDAVPGRLNETWFKVDRPGLYYGQCYELCGARHAYMPIAVEVLPRAQFNAWVLSKGGKIAGAPSKNPDATANSPLANPAPAAAGGVKAAGPMEAAPAPSNVMAGTAKAPVTNQSAQTPAGTRK
jgi:cytochrome c oxidase subunit 2